LTAPERVEIGRVAKAHGLTGEVGVKLHWSHSEILFSVDEVLVELGGQERVIPIERARATPKGVLLKLAGVDDRTQAEALRGARILVQRSALPELGEGEYYLSDLVGFGVVAPDGEIGEVVEVRVHPSVDSAIIRAPDGRLLEQPLVDAWLEEVDLEARVLRLSTREGLVEA
jgi:16S rRNA processing protein RimM